MLRNLLTICLVAPVLLSADSARERLTKATTVIHDMRRASDKGIPAELLERAQCVVVVPGLKKIAFIGGGKFGRGFASCMTSKGWSGPAGVRIEGGSFGLQLGASSTDVLLLVMNQGGMTKLMADKFTIGGDASAAAGPLGRTLTANTDVLLKAEVLSYSRARGLFAGLSLDGATLRPDSEVNRELYGNDVTNLAILKGEVPRPAAAAAFLAQVQRFSAKGAPPKPAVTKKSRAKAEPAASSTTDNSSSSAPGNTSSTGATADNSKNNKSDLEITRQIRRSIVNDKSLSTAAHNVKVIVQHGAVTLRGTVPSEAEKSSIQSKAAAVAGDANVTNSITVSAPK